MTTLETLRAARELLAPSGAWCQHDDAVREDGTSVSPYSPEAVAWCLAGAVRHVSGLTGLLPARRATLALAALDLGVTVPEFNDADGRTQAEVLELLDRKIAELGAGDE